MFASIPPTNKFVGILEAILMKMLEISVSKKAVEHGLKLGEKVYIDKLNFPDKLKFQGGANELQADIYGFIAESMVCEHFNQPLPAFKKQKVDKYDLMIRGLRVDVKKVGFSRRTGAPMITINKHQFARKKGKIDAFLLCAFKGVFHEVEIRGFKVFTPTSVAGKLLLVGWILTREVERKARTYFWKDKDGTPKDESYRLQVRQLHNAKELIE